MSIYIATYEGQDEDTPLQATIIATIVADTVEEARGYLTNQGYDKEEFTVQKVEKKRGIVAGCFFYWPTTTIY